MKSIWTMSIVSSSYHYLWPTGWCSWIQVRRGGEATKNWGNQLPTPRLQKLATTPYSIPSHCRFAKTVHMSCNFVDVDPLQPKGSVYKSMKVRLVGETRYSSSPISKWTTTVCLWWGHFQVVVPHAGVCCNKMKKDVVPICFTTVLNECWGLGGGKVFQGHSRTSKIAIKFNHKYCLNQQSQMA